MGVLFKIYHDIIIYIIYYMIICVVLMQRIKNEIGENADPSNKADWVNGVSIPRRGYPIGLWNSNALTVDDKFDASTRDADDYCI